MHHLSLSDEYPGKHTIPVNKGIRVLTAGRGENPSLHDASATYAVDISCLIRRCEIQFEHANEELVNVVHNEDAR